MGVSLLLAGALFVLGTSQVAHGLPRNPAKNEVLFSELMIEPGDGLPRWIELSNRTDQDLSLEGCQFAKLREGRDTIIGDITPYVIPANGYALIRYATGSSPEFPGECALQEDTEFFKVQLVRTSQDAVALLCPEGVRSEKMVAVDGVIYDWREYGEAHKGTSLVRDMDSGTWCLGVDEGEVCDGLIGSPGQANTTVCGDGGDGGDPGDDPDDEYTRPGAGEVLFSELMIEPADDQPQWLEFINRTDQDLSLNGCELLRPSTASQITTLTSVTVPANGHALLRYAAGSSPEFPGACGLSEDGQYTKVKFIVSREDAVVLQCPTGSGEDPMEVVDQITYNWGKHRAHKGTSMVRDMTSDTMCLGEDEDEVCEGLIGSPGQANTTVCAGGGEPGDGPDDSAPNPGVGDVVFNELMIEPIAGPKWIELRNLTNKDFSLKGCQFFRPSVQSSNTATLGSVGIKAEGYAVLARTGADDWPLECGDGPDGTFGTINMVMTSEDTIELYCPSEEGDESSMELIDQVTFNWSRHRAHKGTSLVRDLANDTWCAGVDEGEVCEGLIGSPGQANTTVCAGGGEPGDGPDDSAPNPGVGDVVFNELMIEPIAGPKWIELRNLTNKDFSLKGCQFFRPSVQSSNTATLGSVGIKAEGYAVLARTGADDWPLECGDGPDGTFGTINMVMTSEDTIELYCPSEEGDESSMELIDQVTFNWSRHRGDKGTSLIYDFEQGVWCLGSNEGEICAGMVASPGAANGGCGGGGMVDPTGVPHPEVGDITFNEMMIEPSDGHAKWIEFKNNTGKELSLQGCRIFRPSVASSNSAVLSGVVVPENGYVFLTRSDYPADCGSAPDGTFGTITLIISGPDSLQLQCPVDGEDPWAGEPIDEVEFNWKPYRDFKGTSLIYDEEAGVWCVGEEEDEVCEGLRGSPGAANASCAVVDPGSRFPVPGEVAFTELMIEPADGHTQWVELENLSNEPLSLTGCRLRRTMVSSSSTSVLGMVGVEAKGVIFLAKGTNYPADCGPLPDATYGTISMKLTGEDTLALECPIAGDDPWAGEPIDTVTYNWGSRRRYKGTSLTKDPTSGEWCVATAEELMCEGLRGSPGTINAACEERVRPVLGQDEGCDCAMIGAGPAGSTGGSKGSLLLVLAVLMGMGVVRRSSRRS